MRRPLVVIGAVLAAVLIVYSLYLSNHTAMRLRHDTDTRAVAACKSSTELRSLLNDLDTIITGASKNPSPALASFSARIHRYTDHNPNCDHLPTRNRRTP